MNNFHRFPACFSISVRDMSLFDDMSLSAITVIGKATVSPTLRFSLVRRRHIAVFLTFSFFKIDKSYIEIAGLQRSRDFGQQALCKKLW